MQTARVTVLTIPQRKAEWESRASRLGISTGELVRDAMKRTKIAEAQSVIEGELALLVAELEHAVPLMAASLDRSIGYIAHANQVIESCLAEIDALRQ